MAGDERIAGGSSSGAAASVADGMAAIALGTETMDVPRLIVALLGMTAGDSTRVIQIRADRGANYGAVVNVIDELANNGMVHIALISDSKPRTDLQAADRSAAR